VGSAIIKSSDMGSLTRARLVLAVISTSLEEVAIYVIWRWLLPEFDINLPFQVLIGVMAAWLVFGVWLFVFTTRALRKQVPVGLPSMVGTRGKVAGKLSPEGMVRIRGELWGATSDEGDIDIGEEVVVVSEDGLKLSVRRVGDRTKH
jgi:membrane-bound ClpP family serine protease